MIHRALDYLESNKKALKPIYQRQQEADESFWPWKRGPFRGRRHRLHHTEPRFYFPFGRRSFIRIEPATTDVKESITPARNLKKQCKKFKNICNILWKLAAPCQSSSFAKSILDRRFHFRLKKKTYSLFKVVKGLIIVDVLVSNVTIVINSKFNI